MSPLKSSIVFIRLKILFLYLSLIRLPWVCCGRMAGIWWYHIALGLVNYILTLPFRQVVLSGVLWNVQRVLWQQVFSGMCRMRDGRAMSQGVDVRIPKSAFCGSNRTYWPKIGSEMFQTWRFQVTWVYSGLPVIIEDLRVFQSSSSPRSKHRDRQLYSKDHMQLISSGCILGWVAGKQLVVQGSK